MNAFQCSLVRLLGLSRLLKKRLDSGQHIVNHHIRSRFNTLGATGLKIDGANLVTQDNTLCLDV
ncbi:hypothetical protein J2X66_005819 [Pseudomonas sp. 3296]|jgi:hypothetical protein|nr:hypothetical protein [Pseudomonas sp. 3296]